MKALLIEFDLKSGKRAGNIQPKEDKNLLCYGWQNLDVNPALEIRIINDNRDLSQYENIKGITILHNNDEINNAIKKYMPPQKRKLENGEEQNIYEFV